MEPILPKFLNPESGLRRSTFRWITAQVGFSEISQNMIGYEF
jgi:hypothetical protein